MAITHKKGKISTGNHKNHPYFSSYIVMKDNITAQISLCLNSHKYLRDHIVSDKIILPGSIFVELANIIGGDIFNSELYQFKNVKFRSLYYVTSDVCELVVVFSRTNNKLSGFSFKNISGSKIYAQGEILIQGEGHKIKNTFILSEPEKKNEFYELLRSCNKNIKVKDFYRKMTTAKLFYGKKFRLVNSVWKGEKELIGNISLLPEMINDKLPYKLHPALLDCCFQMCSSLIEDKETDNFYYIPISMTYLELYGEIRRSLWCHVWKNESAFKRKKFFQGNIDLYDEKFNRIGKVRGLKLMRVKSLPIS